MPTSALRPCSMPGCSARVAKGYCPDHARKANRAEDERRGNFRQRGYTGAWSRLSKARLQQFPLCADPYHIHDIGAFAEVTDHIMPLWAGGALLDPANLQSLCNSCNLRKDRDDRKRYPKAAG